MTPEILASQLIGRIGIPVQRRTVAVGGVWTAYIEAGVGDPVLLLHGGDAGVGGIRWLPVIGPLSRGFRVIVPDMPGYGASAKPWASYDREYFSWWLRLFLAEMELDPIRLVAHSLGGAVALQCALEAPEKIGQLVLVNAAGLGPSSQKVSLQLMVRMMWGNLLPTAEGSRWFLSHQVLYDPRHISQELLDIEEYGRSVIRASGGKRVFWLGRGKAIEPFAIDQLSRVMCPTVIIWGADDQNFPLSAAEEATRVIPHAQLRVIPKAKHTCFADRPEEFNSILIQCLSAAMQAAR